MAALVHDNAAEGNKEGYPCSPATPQAISWENMGLGPAPPTNCVLVDADAGTPPSPATPRSMVTSAICSSGSTCSSRYPVLQACSADVLSCKRKIDFAKRAATTSVTVPAVHHHGVHKPQTPSVVRRNERERNRVRLVNLGFTTLRQHVPAGRENRKMSKVETLRSAAEYIQQLQNLLRETDNQNNFAFGRFASQGSGEHELSLQHLAAACDIQQPQQLSPGGSLGESDRTPSPGAYSSGAEESSAICSSGPLTPDDPSRHLAHWLQ